MAKWGSDLFFSSTRKLIHLMVQMALGTVKLIQFCLTNRPQQIPAQPKQVDLLPKRVKATVIRTIPNAPSDRRIEDKPRRYLP